MPVWEKNIKGKNYYYLRLDYRVMSKTKTFSKYIGAKKPSKGELQKISDELMSEIIAKLSGKSYTTELMSKKDLIKALLFRDAFNKKYAELSNAKKREFEEN